MSKAEEIIACARKVVAHSRALREAEALHRRATFRKIEIANRRRPNLPKGTQLSLDLH